MHTKLRPYEVWEPPTGSQKVSRPVGDRDRGEPAWFVRVYVYVCMYVFRLSSPAACKMCVRK